MKKTSLLTIVIFSALFAASCDFNIPVSELSDAKVRINDAKEARADKYSPDNLEAAEKMMFTAHEHVENESEKKAVEAAKEAARLAQIAAEKSWPVYASDTIEDAKAKIAEAEKVDADFAAPEEFEEAVTLLEEAEKFNNESHFKKAQTAAVGAYLSAEEAVNKSLGKVPGLSSEISETRRKIDKYKTASPGPAVLEKLDSAKSELDTAEEKLETGQIRDAVSLITSAKEKTAEAGLLVEVEKINERIANLQQEIKAIRIEDIPDEADRELRKSEDKIKQAENAIPDVETASAFLDEAEIFIKNTEAIIKRETALDRLTSVKSLHERISEKDHDKLFSSELEETGRIIARSESHYKDARYDDSIRMSDQAETNLNAISITLERKLEKEREKKAEEVEPEKVPAKRTYVVRFREPNTDCLWRIAQREYEDARLWPLIYVENRSQIKDPDLIFPGQELVIPSVPEEKETEE